MGQRAAKRLGELVFSSDSPSGGGGQGTEGMCCVSGRKLGGPGRGVRGMGLMFSSDSLEPIALPSHKADGRKGRSRRSAGQGRLTAKASAAHEQGGARGVSSVGRPLSDPKVPVCRRTAGRWPVRCVSDFAQVRKGSPGISERTWNPLCSLPPLSRVPWKLMSSSTWFPLSGRRR